MWSEGFPAFGETLVLLPGCFSCVWWRSLVCCVCMWSPLLSLFKCLQCVWDGGTHPVLLPHVYLHPPASSFSSSDSLPLPPLPPSNLSLQHSVFTSSTELWSSDCFLQLQKYEETGLMITVSPPAGWRRERSSHSLLHHRLRTPSLSAFIHLHVMYVDI